MKKRKPKVLVVLPAYNAERTLPKVYRGIPKHKNLDVLLVDDASTDNTSKLSKKLGIKTITHSKNKGYGGNQKTCYTYAIKGGFDFVIMLHPDGQYDPKDINKFIKAYDNNEGDLIMGSRFLKGGDKETPFYKSISIRVITLLFNLVLGTTLTEANTGYRGYKIEVLKNIPFMKNGNGYIFDPQAIIQTIQANHSIAEIPVNKAYNPERIEPKFFKSIEHGFENLSLLAQYLLHKWRIKKARFLK